MEGEWVMTGEEELDTKSASWFCPRRPFRLCDLRACPCCGPGMPVPPVPEPSNGWSRPSRKASRRGPVTQTFQQMALDEDGAVPNFPYVDTHVHLDEVLAEMQRRTAVPSVVKRWLTQTPQERCDWRTLGWTRGQWELVLVHEKRELRNKTWDLLWSELTGSQRQAASFLGWDSATWESWSYWPVSDGVAWSDIQVEVREKLKSLGESEDSWEESRDEQGQSRRSGAGIFGDFRLWRDLRAEEHEAAERLGFSQRVWDMEELADVERAVRDVFGDDRFLGCVTQGCDPDSLPRAVTLALSHPRVFASLGCHPKNAWSYDEKFENRLLDAFERCGSKAVAWGEFGLDYSHPTFGRDIANRRKQREVFVRQLQLAVARDKPLMLHIRNAERDSLRLIRRWVPRHWKMHIHSYLGTIRLMNAFLNEFPHAYFGITGTVVYDHAAVLCKRCPLERILLETDAPYLGSPDKLFSHPGQIVDTAILVAELKGVTTCSLLDVANANARFFYGF